MDKDSAFWTHPVSLLLSVCILMLIVGIVRWFFGTELNDLLLEALFVIVLVSIGLLKAVYPKFSNLVEKGFGYYFLGTFLLIALLAPLTFVLFATRWALSDLNQIGQIAFFAFAAVLWCSVLSTLVYMPWRNWIFDKMAALGWVLPLIFLLNYITVSVILFGSVSFLVVCGGESACDLAGVQHADITPDRFFDLFLWHVLDAIPALKITDTLNWSMPLDYGATPSLLGVLLIIFKIAVIVPGIGAFTSYWKIRDKPQSP